VVASYLGTEETAISRSGKKGTKEMAAAGSRGSSRRGR